MSCNSAIYTANTSEQAYGCCNLATLQIRLGDEDTTVANTAVRVEKL